MFLDALAMQLPVVVLRHPPYGDITRVEFVVMVNAQDTRAVAAQRWAVARGLSARDGLRGCHENSTAPRRRVVALCVFYDGLPNRASLYRYRTISGKYRLVGRAKL